MYLATQLQHAIQILIPISHVIGSLDEGDWALHMVTYKNSRSYERIDP